MKKAIVVLAAVGTMVLTGCMSNQYGDEAVGPVSALGFSPVTSPVELVKWSQDFPNIRSIETYTFVAPATVDETTEDVPEFSETLPPGSVFVEAAGGEPKRIIRHSPHVR